MKLAKAFATISFFLLLATSLRAACTSATAVGTFGFTTTGTLILPTAPAPIAAVGLGTFDLHVNVTRRHDSTEEADTRGSVNSAFAEPCTCCRRLSECPQLSRWRVSLCCDGRRF